MPQVRILSPRPPVALEASRRFISVCVSALCPQSLSSSALFVKDASCTGGKLQTYFYVRVGFVTVLLRCFMPNDFLQQIKLFCKCY
jgi:hypothetical protein